jgi:ABC-type Fe3+/spermidine/putrescine transport system ATPase subunit
MTTITGTDTASANALMPAPEEASDASTATPAVRLSHITKHYGEVVALNDVSLEVGVGEFLSILGPSGSGKTTTMRMIGGFEQPDSGTVEIAGQDVGHLPPYRRDVNTVFQSYALFPHMTVVDNVAYGLKMKGVGKKQRRARAGEMLELVQLAGHAERHPGQLSGGMKQRVALARALVNRPSVLLLDEPLGALDRKLREEMQIELRRIQATVGVTFVYVTHDQEEALSMSDRLVVMRNGQIEQIGSTGDVYDHPATLWVSDFVGGSSHIGGRITSTGETFGFETDVAKIEACWTSPGLSVGDHAVAVVRPEHIGVAASPEHATAANTITVTVEEILNMGSQAKIVARTPGGTEFMASVIRTRLDSAVRPGAQVTMFFKPLAVRIYAIEPSGAAQQELEVVAQ